MQHSRLEPTSAIHPRSNSRPRWLLTGLWISIAIAVAVVIRRLLALFHPSRSGPPQLATLDAFFSGHASLTLVHIVPALFFVLLIPMFYSRNFGDRVWTERLLYGLGGVVGLTAYAMSVHAVGGWVERSAVLFFNSLFLFSLVRSYRYRQRGQLLLKRSWMTRAIAILLGIATTRPVMGIFFATSPLTHLEPKQFFGIAFWIGFSINTIAVELWLSFRERQPQIGRLVVHSEL